MGVALTSCTLPGKAKDERIGAAEMEVGLGIHGEPGRTHVTPSSSPQDSHYTSGWASTASLAR